MTPIEPSASPKPRAGGAPDATPTQRLPVTPPPATSAAAAPPAPLAPSAVPAPPQRAVEACRQCAAPLRADQRYCLNCGAPRSYLSSAAFSGLPGGPSNTAGVGTAAAANTPAIPPRGNSGGPLTLTQVLLGVIALVLAVGVGVLIGHSVASTSTTPSATTQPALTPAGAAAGAAVTTSTAVTAFSTATAATTSAAGAGTGSGSGNGVGESINKPARLPSSQSPASAKSGKSYEQKSKELPNVVETP